MSKEDLRVKKTLRGLREAFIRLILRQGYDSISIQDIADEAETARVTFYRHYKDKEELLTDCLNTLYEELAARTETFSVEGLQNGYSPVIKLYEHMQEQETLYRVLFSSRGTQIVIERMRSLLAGLAITQIERQIPADELLAPVEIIAYHAASAQIGLAIWWLDHNKPYPPQYMAQISLWLTLAGITRAFGRQDFRIPPPPKPDSPNG